MKRIRVKIVKWMEYKLTEDFDVKPYYNFICFSKSRIVAAKS